MVHPSHSFRLHRRMSSRHELACGHTQPRPMYSLPGPVRIPRVIHRFSHAPYVHMKKGPRADGPTFSIERWNCRSRAQERASRAA